MVTIRPSSSSYTGGTAYRTSSGAIVSQPGTSSGGVSYDPYLRDAQGNPIGTRVPPPGSTSESIATSIKAAGGGGSSGGGTITGTGGMTSTEIALRQSLPPELRNLSPQEVRARQYLPGRERTFTFKGGAYDESLMSKAPTAKEEVLLMSLPDSRIKTKQSFIENAFYENILGQRRKFEAQPELSSYGMSTPGITTDLGKVIHITSLGGGKFERQFESGFKDFVFKPSGTPSKDLFIDGGELISGGGEQYFFIPDVKYAEAESRQAFAELPKGERIKLIGTEVGLGAARGGVGLLTFGTDILVGFGKGKIREGESFKPFDMPFGETEKAIKMRFPSTRDFFEAPVGFGGKATELGVGLGVGSYALFKGYKGFQALKATGFTTREATTELLGFVSPLRPKPGVYTTKLTGEEPFEFVSTLEKRPGGIKIRQIKGAGEDFIIDSKQVFRTLPSGEDVSLGGIRTTITKPGTLIGGGTVREGIIIGETEGFTLDIGKVGSASAVRDLRTGLGRFRIEKPLDLSAGVSKIGVVQQPKYSLFLRGEIPGEITGFGRLGGRPSKDIFKIGGVSKEISPRITEMALGKARPVLMKTGIKYRVKPTIKGIEFDITPKDIGIGDIKITRLMGTTKTPLSKTFTPQMQLKVPKQISTTTSTKAQLKAIQSSLSQASIQQPRISQFYGMGLYERTEGGLLPRQMGVQRMSLLPEKLTIERERPSLLTIPSLKLPTAQRGRQDQIAIVIPKLDQPLRIRQEEKLIPQLKFPRPTPPKIPRFTYDFGFRTPPFIPLLFPLLGQEGRGKRKIAKRGFVFTPSLGVVLAKELRLNLKGVGEGFRSQTGLYERKFKTGIKLPTII